MKFTRPRPARRTRRRAGSAGLVGLAGLALALTGCGSIGIHPGSAAVVGDRSVTMSKIDDTAVLYCKAYVAHAQSQQQQSGPTPMKYFRSFVASSLVERLLGQQLAAQYDVQPAPGYQQQVSQFQQELAGGPADQRDAVITVQTADAYLQNIQVAIGEKLTGNSGQGNADIKANLERGKVATQDWLDHHQLAIDPVFGVTYKSGTFTPVPDQTSYPKSAIAAAGAKTTGAPDPQYTAALPASQVCQ